VIVDAAAGSYVLRTGSAEPVLKSAAPGLAVSVHEDCVVVGTLGGSDNKRIELIVDYIPASSVESAEVALEHWPGEVWRAHTARTEFSAPDALTLRTASGKVMELTPAGGRFGLALFARRMAPGEWPANKPQEHHILVLWPLTSEVPEPDGDLPRARSADSASAGTSALLEPVLALFADGITPVIRTDFSDDAAWDRVLSALTEPAAALEDDSADEDGYVPHVRGVDDEAFEGLDAQTLRHAYDEDRVGYVLLADARSMLDAPGDLTVLYVDLYDEPGRSFRCAAGEVAGIEANLAIANMDFADFADRLDAEGVFRGFSV